MANFYATYSASAASSSTVTAMQGTSPWIVAGGQTAGASGTAVLTVQGIAGGTAVPISGTITATNPSVSATGAAVPASGTYIAASVAGTLTGLVATANGLKVDGSAVTQPVSGTVAVSAVGGTVAVTQSTSPWVTSASQSGTWNINNISGTVSLPTGAATETTLAAINTKTPALGQAVMASSSPVVIASDQSAVPVSGSVTVSGTVAATQSGTWTVQPGNTANTTPWLATIAQGGNSATVSAGGALKVDASASTQPVSGTVTANQGTSPWIVAGGGTAGSAATGVVTIQGIASMTAVKVDGSAVTQPVSGTVTANAGSGTFTTDQVATTTATFQDGAIAFGSLTTSFATVITTGGALKNVSLRNNTNAVVVVSLDGGSTTSYTLDAGDALSLDLKSLGRAIPTSTALQAKYSGSAPTSGSIRINGVY